MHKGGCNNGGVDWKYFDKFEEVTDKYMLPSGEGDTVASQIVTAINKLVYRWYNDGDIYDNTYWLDGGYNDLSSYANWLYKYVDAKMLTNIIVCRTDAEYKLILKELADTFLNEDVLVKYEIKKVGTIYECDGIFQFSEGWECDEFEDEDLEW